jgi:putative ABC transport system permease protein
MRVSMAGPRFSTSANVEQVARTALDGIRSIPGVTAATATCCVPLQGGYGLPFNIVGRANEGPFTGGSGVVISSSGYFDAFDIPVVRGRAFNDGDDGNAPPVIVISQALADQYWQDGADPLQDRMLIGGGAANMKELAGEPVRRIIGIVGDVRSGGLSNDPGPIVYIPQAQVPDALNALNMETTPMAFVVRTRGDPMALSAAVQQALRQVIGLPVTDAQSLEQVVRISVSRQRLNMLLMSVFGASALLLAAIGIYGLMAYAVQQRTQEVGIRMALGARPEHVRSMVIRQGMLLVAVGIGVGLVAALYLAKLLAAVLFGVEPRDAAVFVSVPVVLTLIALAAVAIPAARASRTDPLEALRYE